MNFKKILCVLVLPFCLIVLFSIVTTAQERRRVVEKTTSSRPTTNPQTVSPNSSNKVQRPSLSQPTNPTNQTPTLSQPTNPPKQTPQQRPTLTDKIVVVENKPNQESLVKKTGSSQPTNPVPNYSASSNRLAYSASLNSGIFKGIQDRLGIPYRYGSTGPNRYDCSGFVWSVFNDAGIFFERSSAKTFWETFEPVIGDDRYKFGTLVFFNRLRHVGIVVDEDGFYHASTSKGITYSKFSGYWEKRIVGFRRIPLEYFSK